MNIAIKPEAMFNGRALAGKVSLVRSYPFAETQVPDPTRGLEF
jgi:hypothetical protein